MRLTKDPNVMSPPIPELLGHSTIVHFRICCLKTCRNGKHRHDEMKLSTIQAASNQICSLGSSMTKAMSCEVPDTLEPLRLVIT